MNLDFLKIVLNFAKIRLANTSFNFFIKDSGCFIVFTEVKLTK